MGFLQSMSLSFLGQLPGLALLPLATFAYTRKPSALGFDFHFHCLLLLFFTF